MIERGTVCEFPASVSGHCWQVSALLNLSFFVQSSQHVLMLQQREHIKLEQSLNWLTCVFNSLSIHIPDI